MTLEQKKEIAHYLETGEDEPTADAWPGNVIDREIRQDQALRDALIAEVKRRTRGRRLRGDASVDRSELVDILRDATQARSGWKRILARCAEQRSRTRSSRNASLLPAERLGLQKLCSP